MYPVRTALLLGLLALILLVQTASAHSKPRGRFPDLPDPPKKLGIYLTSAPFF